MKRPIRAALSLALILAALPALAGETALRNFSLSNGLRLFVYRDTALPLARIQIVFRAGAIAQDRGNAGIFHVYEHLFYRGGTGTASGSTAIKAALSRMGVRDWNGGTSSENMGFSFSLPSLRLREGLAFLADKLASPIAADQAALNREKQIIEQELSGLLASPDTIYEAAMTRLLFGKFPWRKDPAGSLDLLRSVGLADLRALQQTWFVPNNAALIVSGDVDPETVRSAVETLFAAWKAGADPWKESPQPFPKPGVTRPTWIAMPDPSMPEGLGLVELRYRGPDYAADRGAALGAELWTALAESPQGRFKSSLAKNLPKLRGPESILLHYESLRDGSWFSVSAPFAVEGRPGAAEFAQLFKERTRAVELTAMKLEAAYFSQAEYAAAQKRLVSRRVLELDSANAMSDALATAWAAGMDDHFVDYAAAMNKADNAYLYRFIDAYVMRNLEVIALRLNPEDYEREKRSLSAAGFLKIDASNAFWWKQ